MDPIEEQTQELEVLESIYPDEIITHNNDPVTKFSILVKLDTSSTSRTHHLVLNVEYPPLYPEELPILEVEIPSGNELAAFHQGNEDEDDYDDEDYGYENSADEDGEDKVIDFAESIELTKDDLNILKGKLIEFAEEQIGIPMIFALVTQLKEDAEGKWAQKLELKIREHDKKQQELEEIEQRKFQGTKLTKENFASWRESFRKEMKIDERLQDRFTKMHNGKLSGKQIFESGLAKEGDEDDIEGVTEGVSQLQS
ncbi:RWD domain-containing protein [Scheffersomyces amazonensis]|uniref:RWD domain-containing protein n=1 Tax=Scheffersomyces amazonensis TaxID=1078765 RepID=UPI00315D9320